MALVLYGDYPGLNTLIESFRPSKVFILTDRNTKVHCYPVFQQGCRFPHILLPVVEAGEQHKNLESCTQLWAYLLKHGADRHSILLNLGGGVVTDLGGFVAATYQRGIRFIHVPTSLLAMADAAIGGKTGVDFGGLKNQIGLIKEADAVFIDTSFLQSLPERHLRAGYAEMLKISLMCDPGLWLRLSSIPFGDTNAWPSLVREAVELKQKLVDQDLNDHGIRKLLNFGHTIGHAIESYYLKTHKPLLHGEAVALGMISELQLAVKYAGFPIDEARKATRVISQCLPELQHPVLPDVAEVLNLMKYDKKNRDGKINFSLPSAPGKGQRDHYGKEEDILEVLQQFHI